MTAGWLTDLLSLAACAGLFVYLERTYRYSLRQPQVTKDVMVQAFPEPISSETNLASDPTADPEQPPASLRPIRFPPRSASL